jgi:hypothetical protein
MQRGGGGSLVAADGSGGDADAWEGAAGPVASGGSVGDVDAAVDAEVAGGASEDDGDSAGGGAAPPHAPANEALAITGASRHASEQPRDDQERMRLMRVRIASAHGRIAGTFSFDWLRLTSARSAASP